MADIRRPTADVNPVNYVQPGVVDNSAAVAVEGLTKLGAAGVEVDARLAKKRFGEALEALRAQRIASEAPDMGDAEPDVGVALAGRDKSSLKDFESVLKRQDSAVTQGRMSQAEYRIRAERLYRIAISKRPGLANEFRSVAANYLGMDVVGATVDELVRAREEEEREKAAKVKSAQEMLVERDKFMRQQWYEAGVPGVDSIIPGTPQAAEFFSNNMHIFAQRRAAALALKDSTQQVEMNKNAGLINQSVNETNLNDRITALVLDFPTMVNQKIAELEAAGGADDPAMVEALAQNIIAQYDHQVGQLSATFKGDQAVSDTYMAEQLKRMSFLKENLMKAVSGERNANYSKNVLAALQNSARYALLKDPQMAVMEALSGMFTPETTERLFKDQVDGLTVSISNAVRGAGTVENNTAVGGNVVRTLIGATWPRPDVQPDPQDVKGAVEGIDRILTSFFLADNKDFKVANFTKDGTKQGVLTHMNRHAKVVVPTLTQEQKDEITTSMAAAAVNSITVLVQRLYAKSPSLIGKLDKKFHSPDGMGNVFKAKPGVTLSKLEAQAVAEYNRQANASLITDTMKQYSGMKTDKEVWGYIASLYPDVQEAQKKHKEQEKKAKPAVGQSLTGSSTLWWRQ